MSKKYWRIESDFTHEFLGETIADSEAGAYIAYFENLDWPLKDVSGYPSPQARSGITAYEIDVDELIAALVEETGEAAFQDAYGDGLCIIAGVRYESCEELAMALNQRVEDFDVNQRRVI